MYERENSIKCYWCMMFLRLLSDNVRRFISIILLHRKVNGTLSTNSGLNQTLYLLHTEIKPWLQASGSVDYGRGRFEAPSTLRRL